MEKNPKLPIIIAGMLTDKKYFCEDTAVGCGERVFGFKDRDSAREYKTSRLCQKCQDNIFTE